jgi:hypothetical protein
MSSMGMDKSGTHQIPQSAWTQITSWTVRTGFPATVITSDRLVIDNAGTYTINWRAQYSASGGTQQFQIVHNGSTVIGSSSGQTGSGTITPINLAPGDTLELQGNSTSFNTNHRTVLAGSTTTYIEAIALTTPWTGDAQTTAITWNRSAAAGLDADIPSSDTAVSWSVAAEMQHEGAIPAQAGINWDIEADLYQGIHYDAAAAVSIGWDTSADMTLIPDVTSLPSVFENTELSVSVHTADGRVVGDFPCNMVGNFRVGRERVEVSTATVQVATPGDPELIDELRPWVHWISLWLGDTAIWTGPLWRIQIGKAITTLSARDPAIFMYRTRVPVTKTYTDTVPARIAQDLWRAMNQLHRLTGAPLVLPGVADETFTVSAVANTRMLNQFMDELVKVGLEWTVAAGRPILGEFPKTPVAELQECDFLVELERVRDGSQTFNDVRVQGQNWAANAVADLAGLHLQGLVSMDDIFGASNIQRAAEQYTRQVATLRDDLIVPAGASLHPQAPVTYDDLIPGKCFAVYTETAQQLMRLDQVEISGGAGAFDVQVTLIALQSEADVRMKGDTAR